MIPAGYMAKRVEAAPASFPLGRAGDIGSVSGCISRQFADYVPFWKHNGYWFFDSPEIIRNLAKEHSIELQGASLFYYECHEEEFDGTQWRRFAPESSMQVQVLSPRSRELWGFDVVAFSAGTLPECSPLSCNGLAKEIPTNRHCLLESFEEAERRLSSGAFNNSEPGPYRIFAVYSVPWE
jgi:hypothetical protein